MLPNLSVPRSLTLAVAATTALSLGACGGDDGQDEVRQQTRQVQRQSESFRDKAQKIADDLKNGKITAEDAKRLLQDQARTLQRKVEKTASDAIDRAKESGLSDEAEKQLDAAKKQLDKLP